LHLKCIEKEGATQREIEKGEVSEGHKRRRQS